VGRDPYEYFRVEAREILDGLGRGALQLEKGATPEITAGILRLAHTLKGAARVVKQPGIAESAHAIEERLADLRETKGPVESARVDDVLRLIDAIATGLRGLDSPASNPTAKPAAPAPVDEDIAVVRADAADLDAVIDGIGEAGLQVRTMRRVLGGLGRARHLAELLSERVVPGSGADTSRSRDGAAAARLGPLANELCELLTGFDRRLTDTVDQAERELREVRDAADKLRLVAVSTLFVTLERTARDVAQSVGKEAVFEATGGEIRLEAQVLSAVQRALVQLIRNAVAHGLETAAERRNAGKNGAGRVQVEVVRRGNRVAFACRDDGRGIDLAAVRRVAQRKGILPEGAPRETGDLLKLLLRGGLTTSGAVTEVAGRGIGLDVVREVAAQLGGEVTLTTDAGRGTTFELAVPLSLSSLDALLVEVDGISAAIPLDSVRRTVRLVAADIARTATGESVVHEGRVIPFIPLARPLGRRRPEPKSAARSAVVVAAAEHLAALAVDRLLGTANVVVRPLPAFASAAPVVVGAAIDGEGTPQLVLDPAELVAGAQRAEREASSVDAAPTAPVLVIDDSLTTRMLEQSILESAGYEVDLATSAEEGIEKARRRHYALFLVDVEMPGMDGFTFVATTRADPALRETPAILVTSRNAPEDRQRGHDAGAGGYVVKGDFDQAELLALIKRLVR
jgi:two-component system chemotaxis sensor kinase CheA